MQWVLVCGQMGWRGWQIDEREGRERICTSQFFNTPPLYLHFARLQQSNQSNNLLQRDAMDVYGTAIQGLICMEGWVW